MGSAAGAGWALYGLYTFTHGIFSPHRRLAAPAAATISLAEHSRSVPHLAVGDHAAADPGRHRDPVLRALPGPLSRRGRAGRRRSGRRDALLGRPGLLRARPQPAPLRTRNRARLAGPLPAHGRSHRHPAGDRPLHGGRHRRLAYGERSPILDGNVKRVFTRHFGIAGDPSSARSNSACGRWPTRRSKWRRTWTWPPIPRA